MLNFFIYYYVSMTFLGVSFFILSIRAKAAGSLFRQPFFVVLLN